MTKEKAVVNFFFDVFSPYSWFGFEGLTRCRQFWPIELKLRPLYFAGVIKKTGNIGAPILVPCKEKYLYQDTARAARLVGIEGFAFPKDFKKLVLSKATANAQRSLIALQLHQPSLVEPVARAFWKRLFVENEHIFELEDVKQVLEGCKVPNTDETLSLIKDEKVKNILKQNTDEAIAEGCFGAPWMHVDFQGKREVFFGSDRLEQIADMIGEKYHGSPKH